GIPDGEGLALVADADGDHGLCVHPLKAGADRSPHALHDLDRILLDPTRPRVLLPERRAAAGHDFALAVDEEALRRARALIDGEDERGRHGGLSPSARRRRRRWLRSP